MLSGSDQVVAMALVAVGATSLLRGFGRRELGWAANRFAALAPRQAERRNTQRKEAVRATTRSGTVAQRHSGAAAQWRRGVEAQWRRGAVA